MVYFIMAEVKLILAMLKYKHSNWYCLQEHGTQGSIIFLNKSNNLKPTKANQN